MTPPEAPPAPPPGGQRQRPGEAGSAAFAWFHASRGARSAVAQNSARRLLALLALLFSAAWAAAPMSAQANTAVPPAEVRAELSDARLQGSARLRFFGLKVYDMRLWTGTRPVSASEWNQPLALEIVYALGLDGSRIAGRALDEMRGIGPMTPTQGERWLAEMTRLFPDVESGDRLTGIQRPGESARFYFNGQPLGEVRDAEFARLFFGIWLSPRSSEPGLREALLDPARGGR